MNGEADIRWNIAMCVTRTAAAAKNGEFHAVVALEKARFVEIGGAEPAMEQDVTHTEVAERSAGGSVVS